MSIKPKNGEVRDVPFLGNDMEAGPPTTDKPLDTPDGPGKADAEMANDPERPSLAVPPALRPPDAEPVTKPVDMDDAAIQEPRDSVFSRR